MLSQTHLDNIDLTIFLCSFVLAWSALHCIDYFQANKSCLLPMVEHYSGNFFVQCGPRKNQKTLKIIFLFTMFVNCEPTLHRQFSCPMLAQVDQHNIVQVIFLCKVARGLFGQQYYLHSIVQVIFLIKVVCQSWANNAQVVHILFRLIFY